MLDCAIIFAHHKDDDVTRDHYTRLINLNPFPVVPARFTGNIGLVPSVLVDSLDIDQWRGLDYLLYGAYTTRQFDAARWVFLEWDALMTVPVREYFDSVWNAQAAASNVERPGKRAWHYFSDHEMSRLPDSLRPHATGIWPLNGLLLSDNAMKILTAREQPREVFSELRLASTLIAAGIDIIEYRRQNNSWHPQFVTSCRTAPDLYHPVKTCSTIIEERLP